MLMNRARDADATGLRQGLEARGDVHAVPEQIPAADHHVAGVHADAKLQSPRRGVALARPRQPLLRLHRALHGIHHARELGQDAVAGGVDDPAAMLGDHAVHDLAACGQQAQGPDLVQAHQPGIARHVRRQDGGELALDPLLRCGHGRQCLSTASLPDSVSGP